MIEWLRAPRFDVARRVWDEGRVLVLRNPFPYTKLDLVTIRAAREDVEYVRKPRGPWQTKPMSLGLRGALVGLHEAMQDLFSFLYAPLGPPAYSQFTFRPTITRGGPHKDKERGTVITAFINLDYENRVWRIGGQEVRFPPGCMWIFQAEKIEHQVVFGRCCAQLNWHLIKEIK